jgi:HipA-like protein
LTTDLEQQRDRRPQRGRLRRAPPVLRDWPDAYHNSAEPAISLSFPKQGAAFEAAVLFPFFFGLLAEGDNKAIQCRVLRIDEEDHFTRLLKTCVTETIGGVTVREAP